MTRLFLAAALIIAAPTTVLAYVGPGAGITAIGTVLALIGAVILAIVGFVWYPLKHLFRRLRKGNRNVMDDRVDHETDIG